MKVSKSTALKLAAIPCFYVGVERLAHGKTMGESLALGLGFTAFAVGILLSVIAFRLERNSK